MVEASYYGSHLRFWETRHPSRHGGIRELCRFSPTCCPDLCRSTEFWPTI